MNKSDILQALKLLSALEVAVLMREKPLPDYLFEELAEVVGKMSKELLRDKND